MSRRTLTLYEASTVDCGKDESRQKNPVLCAEHTKEPSSCIEPHANKGRRDHPSDNGAYYDACPQRLAGILCRPLTPDSARRHDRPRSVFSPSVPPACKSSISLLTMFPSQQHAHDGYYTRIWGPRKEASMPANLGKPAQGSPWLVF